MSSDESLKKMMRAVLEEQGVMDRVKAELRDAIFHSLQATTTKDDTVQVTRPPVPPENLLLNELIKEYLAFNGMEHTLAVFRTESGSGKGSATAVPHAVLATQLGMTGAPKTVPLLYAMLHELRSAKET